MKKYLVKTTCHGYKGRLWDEGEIVELEDDANPPNHFQLIEDGQPVEEKIEDEREDPQKPITVKPGGPPLRPKGGFAAKLPHKVPEPTMTAGKALKNKK